MVNVNIQMATLKERVREVGVKMAIGASGREIFKEFMTEALLLTALGSLVGLLVGRRVLEDHHVVARHSPLHAAEELRLGVRPGDRCSASSSRSIPPDQGEPALADGGAAL